ncbi:MAG: N-formylglutamate amidohydrolase [Pseudomonadota bacterium]
MPVSTIFHIPHASTVIPAEHRAAFLLSDSELGDQVLCMTDHFTDELFNLPDRSVQRIVYPVSRLVLDPERFLDDAQEPMAKKGMGVIYEKTVDGRLLRDKPTEKERAELLERYYHPHHQKFTEAVDHVLAATGRCLIIDCHSFPDAPLPYEDDQNPNRPDICIGTDSFHTDEVLSILTFKVFQEVGFSVAFNRPFAGTIVPMKYYRCTKAVQSIMIEINRKLYMNEETDEKLSSFDEFAGSVQGCLTKLLSDYLRQTGTHH